MENLLPIFVALTGAAVLLQAGLLAAMYLAMRKASSKMEALAFKGNWLSPTTGPTPRHLSRF